MNQLIVISHNNNNKKVIYKIIFDQGFKGACTVGFVELGKFKAIVSVQRRLDINYLLSNDHDNIIICIICMYTLCLSIA